MTAKLTRRKWITIICISVVVLLLAAGGLFYYLINNNIKQIIAEIVHRESKGNLSVIMKSFKFSWTTNRIEIKDFELFSADSSSAQTAYRVKVEDFHIKTNSLWNVAVHKDLQIDSVSIESPDIAIHVLRKRTDAKKNISLSEEVGHVYDGIKRTLTALRLKRFEISDAKLLFDNKTNPNSTPLLISNIQFIVDNLKIDGSLDEEKEKFLFADSIILRSSDQHFTLPDGRHEVGFARLRFNSGLRLIELDSCTITRFATEKNPSAFVAFFDTLRITNLDFNALYLEDRIIVDSAYCINPSVDAILQAKGKKDSSTVKKTVSFLSSTDGSLSIKYVGVHNGQLQVTSERKGKRSSLQTAGFNFELFGLEAGRNAAKGIHFDSIGLFLQKNEFYTPDSNYRVKFDDIAIVNDSILLSSFRITTEAKELVSVQRHHTADKLILSGVDWEALLVHKRVVAEKAILFNPVIDRRNTRTTKRKKPFSIFELFAGVQKSVDLEILDVRNGALHFDMGAAGTVSLEAVNLEVRTNELLAAEQFSSIGKSITNISFAKGRLDLDGRTVHLLGGNFGGQQNHLTLGSISMQEDKQGSRLQADGVTVDGILFNESEKKFIVNSLSWKKASVNIKPGVAKLPPGGNKKTTIVINNLVAANTDLTLSTRNNTIVSTKLSKVNAQHIQLEGKNKPSFEGLTLKGYALDIRLQNGQLSCADYELADGRETSLHDIHITQEKENETMRFAIPTLHIQPDIASSLGSGTLQIDLLSLVNPSIHIRTQKKEGQDSASTKKTILPLLVKKLSLQHAAINILSTGSKGIDSMYLTTDLQAQRIAHSKSGELSIQQMKMGASASNYHSAGGISIQSGDSISANIKNIAFHTGKNKEWNLHLAEMQLRNTKLAIGKTDSTRKEIYFTSLGLHDLQLDHALVKDVNDLLGKNNRVSLSNTTLSFQTKNDIFHVENLHISPGKSSASLASFKYQPIQSQEEFIETHPFQSDYIKAGSGAIKVSNVSLLTFIKEGVLNIGQVEIDDPVISIYRDKNKPFEHGIIKALPVNMIKSINLPMQVRSVLMHNGTVLYTERSDKTKDSGTMQFGNIEAELSNFKNYDLTDKDSLSLKAQTVIMESIPARLHFRESYQDSLAGFVLGVQLKAADLTTLNPVLAPLVSVQLESGMLDTMVMQAVGREYVSFGQMHMYYHDLHVRFLQKGNTHKKTLLTSFMSFVANDFVIRRHNKDRKGMIYFSRVREKAIFNYWVKIILSGLASSTGAKSNRKIVKKYKSELKKKSLPPINFD